jgi:hypothetical protein
MNTNHTLEGIKGATDGYYFINSANDTKIPVQFEAGKLEGWQLHHYWIALRDESSEPVKCSNLDCSVCR